MPKEGQKAEFHGAGTTADRGDSGGCIAWKWLSPADASPQTVKWTPTDHS